MWLAGPFAVAHHRVYADPVVSGELLAACASGLTADALGTLPEIADGDAPFAARGAFAQAWSVAALLDAWSICAPRPAAPALQSLQSFSKVTAKR
jgi:glycogen debranching enzyme